MPVARVGIRAPFLVENQQTGIGQLQLSNREAVVLIVNAFIGIGIGVGVARIINIRNPLLNVLFAASMSAFLALITAVVIAGCKIIGRVASTTVEQGGPRRQPRPARRPIEIPSEISEESSPEKSPEGSKV